MVPRIEIPERFNVVTALVDCNVAQGRGDKVAIYYKNQRLTYRDIQQMVNKAGNALKSLGVEVENRVAILLPDCPEWVISFFAAIKIGAVPIPLNTMLMPKDYEYMLNDSRAKAIIISDDLVKQIEEERDSLRYLRHMVVVGEAQGAQLSYEELINGASPVLEAEDVSKDDIAGMWYTSGSTGLPKGTIHLHHDLIYMGELFNKAFLGLNEHDIAFSVPRLFFSFGTTQLLSSFYLGGSHILASEKPSPDNVLEAITEYKPTAFFGVPTVYVNILGVQDMERYDINSVRIWCSAGEHLPIEVYRRFKKRFGAELLNGIGCTESLTIYLANRPGRVKPGSTGELVPGHQVKIVDDQGQEVPSGEVGELMLEVDSNSPYYWNKHEKTKEVMNGEWIRTGDMFRQDEDGYFWFIGRIDDVIQAGGIKVIPTEVEATLMEHPAVIEAAVVGAADEHGLIKPKAFVTLQDGYKPSPELAKELQQFVKSRIAPYNYPRWVEFVDELPKTATGKIQRFKLR
jgi:benzoate-CoA ligase family protein